MGVLPQKNQSVHQGVLTPSYSRMFCLEHLKAGNLGLQTSFHTPHTYRRHGRQDHRRRSNSIPRRPASYATELTSTRRMNMESR